ncbi:MAG TPA: tRNA (N(6)-L-threonylcarbamoyladenosine(37)-C(2))-methylthiotransferase MtaB [Candidatus Dorea intestinavium]|nr:tRNA (N(6)-L-threonylcarbamoyladenosine(37)-C(2))-methylthiotransferase MtaB [Candidatus Dorea intestinavium]
MGKKVALHNLGCKVNAYETQAMESKLKEEGFEIVPFKESADYYIINTCTVTNIADRKSRQMLHKAKKNNPNAVVVAAGCYVETAKDEVDPAIDIIVGNNKKKDIVEIIKNYEADKDSVLEEMIDINHTDEYEEMFTGVTDHVRANIKVQDGCNQFCSYCIIPYARGRVRSRRATHVIEEVSALAKEGYKEVVLTGIHLSSYGKDTGDNLLNLINQVSKVEGVKRIRLGSLEPRIITEEFVKGVVDNEKFCPHFHLSLQSGCDETLKRMNRKYSAKEYEDACNLLRKYFKEVTLTTDVIVGFPGETKEEFAQSKAFIDRINFYETHIFKYSKRKGTKAEAMKNQVPDDVKAKRSAILIELSEKKKEKYHQELLGQEKEVLFEESIFRDKEQWVIGYTKEYYKLGIKGDDSLINQIGTVKITDNTCFF